MTPAVAVSAFLGESASPLAPDEVDALARRLSQLVADARAAWPLLEVSPTRFVARLGELSQGSIDRAEALRTGDLWLTLAMVDGDRNAPLAFEGTIIPRVVEALRRRGVDAAERDEAAQLLRTAMLVGEGSRAPRIESYAGRAPLERWLVVAAARMLERAKRRDERTRELEDEGLVPALMPAADLEHGLLRAEARDALADALHRAVAELDADDRALLRLHVHDHLSIDDLARLYAVHRATAARKLERARRDLAQQTRRHLAAHLALPPWEVESLIHIVRSSFKSIVGTYLMSTPPAS